MNRIMFNWIGTPVAIHNKKQTSTFGLKFQPLNTLQVSFASNYERYLYFNQICCEIS